MGKLSKLHDYQYLILTSNLWYLHLHRGGLPYAVNLMGLEHFQNLLVVAHDLKHIEHASEKLFLLQKRLLVLGHLARGVMVNPHYFGDFALHVLNKVCHFIVVGGLEAKRKNHVLLFDAVSELLAKGQTSFKVTVVGRGNCKRLPQRLRPYIYFTGYLDFPKMAQKMQEADFFLPLLDPENPAHERYITTGVTGSAQLIYGFCKPPIIHEKFATFYGFDEENALIYQDKDLGQAMQRALSMKKKKYEQLLVSLSSLAADLSRQSVQNLKMVLTLITERKKR